MSVKKAMQAGFPCNKLVINVLRLKEREVMGSFAPSEKGFAMLEVFFFGVACSHQRREMLRMSCVKLD
jgi:hypothetical protein